MAKKFLFLAGFIFGFVLICSFLGVIFAQQGGDGESIISNMPEKRTSFSVDGKIFYTDLKKKGESEIVVKDSNGQEVKISLKDLVRDSHVLATFRKVKDKKGNEKNMLVTLSIIRPAQEEVVSKK